MGFHHFVRIELIRKEIAGKIPGAKRLVGGIFYTGPGAKVGNAPTQGVTGIGIGVPIAATYWGVFLGAGTAGLIQRNAVHFFFGA